MKLNGWEVEVANWPKQVWGEDDYYTVNQFFLLATSNNGQRFAGPEVKSQDFLYDNSKEQVLAVIGCDEQAFDPVALEWGGFFPVYGSDAYVKSGQELKDVDAERNNKSYYC